MNVVIFSSNIIKNMTKNSSCVFWEIPDLNCLGHLCCFHLVFLKFQFNINISFASAISVLFTCILKFQFRRREWVPAREHWHWEISWKKNWKSKWFWNWRRKTTKSKLQKWSCPVEYFRFRIRPMEYFLFRSCSMEYFGVQSLQPDMCGGNTDKGCVLWKGDIFFDNFTETGVVRSLTKT